MLIDKGIDWESEKEFYTELINRLCEDEVFYNLTECPDSDTFRDFRYGSTAEKLEAKGIYIYEGCSRFVIEYPECATVLKATFNREELDRYDDDGELVETGEDYCEAEIRMYEMAKRCEVSHHLAEIRYLTTINNLSFYLCEKMDYVGYDDFYDWAFDYLLEVYCKIYNINTNSESDEYNSDEYNSFIDWFSDEVFNDEPKDNIINCIRHKHSHKDAVRLEEFIRTMHITDLHYGNWGLGMDGNIKIIDYAGYDIPTDCSEASYKKFKENVNEWEIA